MLHALRVNFENLGHTTKNKIFRLVKHLADLSMLKFSTSLTEVFKVRPQCMYHSLTVKQLGLFCRWFKKDKSAGAQNNKYTWNVQRMFLFVNSNFKASFPCRGCFGISTALSAVQLLIAICQHGPWKSGIWIGNGVVPLMVPSILAMAGNRSSNFLFFPPH